jgi:hypothetical protein
MVPQTPSSVAVPLSAFVQATHMPVHAVLQQTPSTQKLDAHSLAIAHIVPLPAPVHVPLLEHVPPLHWFFGSVPAGTIPHWPSLPPVSAAEQA